MNTMLMVCLGICILTVIGYVWGKYPLGIVSCLSMILFMLTGCISTKEALGNMSNSNVVMLMSMFVVSAGFTRTQFVKIIGRSVNVIAKGNINKAMLGFTIASLLAATMTGSAAAAFCIVAPIVSASCKELNISPSKVMFCVGLTCIAGCGVIPVGGNLAVLAQMNGFISANDYGQYQVMAMDLLKARFPISIALLVYCTFFGHKLSPEDAVTKFGDSSTLMPVNQNAKDLPPFQEKCGYIIFILVTLGLLFGTQLNAFLKSVGLPTLESWQIVFIGAVLEVVTGVLTYKEGLGSIPWDMGFLVAGGLSMGTALANTGGGNLIGDAIAGIAGNLGNKYLIGGVFFMVPFILTQIMQNRTVVAIFYPICVLACKSMGINPSGPMILVTAACTTSFMTPMATACVPTIMDMGGYDFKSLFMQSILPAIILSVVNIFWVMSVIPL